MRRLRWPTVAFIAAAVVIFTITAGAQEKKDAAPRITAISPLSAQPGESVQLRLRGIKLDEAQSIRFLTEGTGEIATELKEKKKAGNLAGFEDAESGGTEAEFRFTVPASVQGESLRFKIVTTSGDTDERELRLRTGGDVVEEKDPNDGFMQAQSISDGQTVRGAIKAEKDVDVFRVSGDAGQQLEAEIFASRGGSLLDSMLTLLDSRGRVIASNDDQEKSRDSKIEITLPVKGEYLLSVQDAHDRGSAWHSYELAVKSTP